MKKGFTLVELLAVIVVLALILAIAVPTITNLISNAKKNTFENGTKLVLKSLKIDYDNKVTSSGTFTDTFILYDNGVRTVYPSSNNIDFAISATDGGIVRHSDGTVTLALYDGTNCITKIRTSNDLVTTATDKTTCVSNIIYKQASAPFTNLVTNGEFSTDANSDGLGDSWIKGTNTSALIVNGEQVISPTTNGNDFYISVPLSVALGGKYYIRTGVLKQVGNANPLYLYFVGPGNHMISGSSIKDYSGTSFINVPDANGTSIRVAVFGGTRASTDKIFMDNFIVVDLTTTYSAGNEPNKDQMDSNLNKVWIDTTTNTPKRFTAGGWVNF